jgi:hypothetical protein
VLSADLHRMGIDDGTNSIWPEFTASPLNATSGDARGTWTQGLSAGARGYGLVQFSATQVVMTPKDSTGGTMSGVTPLTIPWESPYRVCWMRG